MQALLFVWRWLFELLFAVLAAYVVVEFQAATGWAWKWSILTIVVLLAAPFAIPPVRRVAVAGIWTAVTRHRLRAYFVECRIYNRSGKLPWILAACPTAVGERVWIWLVPGLSIHTFEDQAEEIGTACWARTARVERHKSIASLVRLDVIRRDPLTTGDVLPSTLVPADASHVAGADSEDTDDVTGSATNGTGPLDLPRTVVDLTVPLTAAGDGKGRKVNGRNGSTPVPVAGSAAASAPVVIRGGEDMSDYV